MGNVAQRVGFASSVGTFEIEISQSDWSKLADFLGDRLNQTFQDQIIELCSEFGLNKSFELNAALLSEYEKQLKAAKKEIYGFNRIAHGSVFGRKDIGRHLQSEFSVELDNLACPLLPHNFFEWDKANESWERSSNSKRKRATAIKLDSEALRTIYRCLMEAIINMENRLEERIESGKSGFAPGRSFKSWIFHLRKCAKKHGYTYGAFNATGGPSKFAQFAFELHRILPIETQESQMNSASAMAQRIKRIVGKKGSKTAG